MPRKIQQFCIWICLLSLWSCQAKQADIQAHVNQQISAIGTSDIYSAHDTSKTGPSSITRALIEDRSGDIWMSTFEGVFKYHDKTFTNMTTSLSESRFFCLLEDDSSKLWFGSIGSGIYSYDGSTFENITTKDGLLNDEVSYIYQTRLGDLWFGTNGGVSRYSKGQFQNFIFSRENVVLGATRQTIPSMRRPSEEVTSILQDQQGSVWIASARYTYRYANDQFSTITHDERPFTNVRSLVQDSRGRIWLGGGDGLWLFDGKNFTQLSTDFVGYLHIDKRGTIWSTSAVGPQWRLSKHTINSSQDTLEPTVIYSGSDMLFGILADKNDNIWIGSTRGVLRYDGQKVEEFSK